MKSGYYKPTIAFIPIVGYIVWHLAFLGTAVRVLVVDHPLRHEPCGESTHAWKYILLNAVWAFVSVSSFCTFPGGGEGARARAVIMAIFHLGLLTWGLLMCNRSSAICARVIEDKFEMVFPFVYACLAHNGLFGSLFLLHEAGLGDCLGYDATIIAEVRVRKHYGVKSPNKSEESTPNMLPGILPSKMTVPIVDHQVYASVSGSDSAAHMAETMRIPPLKEMP